MKAITNRVIICYFFYLCYNKSNLKEGLITLKIATYNVKNKTANKILKGHASLTNSFLMNFEIIKSADPDVIGLQEVTKEEYSMLRKQFERTYNIYGEFRGSFGVTNEACPIMIKKQDINVLDYKTFSLSDDIMKLGNKYKGSLFPRIATYIRLMDGKYEYSIINVHVDNVKKIQNKTFEKNGSLQQILDLSCDGSRIIIGDMNTEIKNGLKDFCLRNSLSDAALPLGNTYKPLNLALDHILYSDSDLSVNEVKAYENAGSDHSLILANMSRR